MGHLCHQIWRKADQDCDEERSPKEGLQARRRQTGEAVSQCSCPTFSFIDFQILHLAAGSRRLYSGRDTHGARAERYFGDGSR